MLKGNPKVTEFSGVIYAWELSPALAKYCLQAKKTQMALRPHVARIIKQTANNDFSQFLSTKLIFTRLG